MSKKVTLTLDDDSYEVLRDRAGSDAAVPELIVSTVLRTMDGDRQQVEYPVPYEQLVKWAEEHDPNDGWADDTSNPFEPEDPPK